MKLNTKSISEVLEEAKKNNNGFKLESGQGVEYAKLDLSSIGESEKASPTVEAQTSGATSNPKQSKLDLSSLEQPKSASSGVVSGAAQGASAGAMFGPYGAIIGGAIGGVSGGMKAEQDRKDFNSNVEARMHATKAGIESETETRRQQILQGYANKLSQTLLR